VFESPLCLHLQLKCNANTPVKKMLDVWPRSFPILIKESRLRLPLDGANIISALEHHDRVSEIDISTISIQLERLYEVMKMPCPVLTRRRLLTWDPAPVLRDNFLGESVPLRKELILVSSRQCSNPGVWVNVDGFSSMLSTSLFASTCQCHYKYSSPLPVIVTSSQQLSASSCNLMYDTQAAHTFGASGQEKYKSRLSESLHIMD
jgi:hypothetical protein